MTILTLYFDGACTPINPGGIATYGWVLLSDNSNLITSDYGEVCRGDTATNNLAEWHALEFGLHWIVNNKPDIDELIILGDSNLVIKQLNGQWACKKPHLIVIRDKCFDLLGIIDKPWQARWVKRNLNKKADALSKLAYVESIK